MNWLLDRQIEGFCALQAHYNRHRPHRALELKPPDASADITTLTEARPGQVRRHDLLGGLLREYRRAA